MFHKSIFSGFLGGFIASLCCLGPTLIVLVGLGAIFGISGLCFGDLRPHFMILGLIAFGLALGLYLYKDKKMCSLNSRKKTWFVVVSVLTMIITYSLIIFFLVPILQAPLVGDAVCSIHV